MKFIGISGGIGSGKSTVAALLAERGAVVIDADQLSRDLQRRGEPLFEQIVEKWGDGVLGSDGELDREKLGQIVFSDRAQLGQLTMMAAPFTEQELVRRALEHEGTETLVVAEAAMYLRRTYGMEGLLVVDAPPEVALARLVGQRGMTEEDAKARLASQLPRAIRVEHADFVIDNSGDRDELSRVVPTAWDWAHSLPDATPRVVR
jgi:dephospho-CoA kinase